MISLSGFTFSHLKELVQFICLFPQLRTLKVVNDDYDAPKPADLTKALRNFDLPYLDTVQMELVQTENRPRGSTPAQSPLVIHLVDWLTSSLIAGHLHCLWMTYTVESVQDDYETVEVMNRLLKACGSSLEELAIAVQTAPGFNQTWSLDNLKGLELGHNRNLKHLYMYRIPWRTISGFLPTIISTSNSRRMETMSLTFLPTTEEWPPDIRIEPGLYQFDVFMELDAILAGNFSTLRRLDIDFNGTVDQDSFNILRYFPKLSAQNGVVCIGSVDEEALRPKWGLP
ncbi:hypothetical protein BXZ70DRAFT_144768 [Cristinia sonorae]|uniref:Uncharacterized protein n=1 Tax=Cristinia sonorae TaxID=1940300 RepID=A0A8K0UPC3_9AGAR|nr:hypothetical protein BXZ70DRAFT_144768 [Cristinia sonorae]